jgi:ABC-2 type transport system ATP-binding protein
LAIPRDFIPTDSPMISVQNASMLYPIPKRYREWVLRPFSPRRAHRALVDASLELERGARVAILGPNGAGKTTLLKLIGGLLVPTKGVVRVNNFDTARHSSAARRSVGFVLNEERSFFWRLTGRQNLNFFGALDNLVGRDLRGKIDDLIRLTGLEKAADTVVSNYSSGMKQRLALARGLLSDPDILILDEPTRTLDPEACEEMRDLILDRIHRGSRKTLLIATHRLEEARLMCDRALVISEGRILAHERLEDLEKRKVDLSDFYREATRRGREKSQATPEGGGAGA